MESTRILLHKTPPPPSTPQTQKPKPKPSTSLSTLTAKTNLYFSSTSKTKPLSYTLSLFPLLPSHDTVTYNTAISACLRHLRPLTAINLFVDMLVSSTCPPDSITLRSVLRACSLSHYPELTMQLHAYIVKLRSGFSLDELIVLNTCLLNGYLELGCFGIAREVFDRIPERDVVAWTSMLRGYVEGGDNEEAIDVFEDMVGCGDLVMNEYVYSCALRACARMCCLFGGKQIHGHVVKSMMDSDVFVGTGLVDLYAKCDDMESAMKAFSEITDPNVVSYNALEVLPWAHE